MAFCSFYRFSELTGMTKWGLGTWRYSLLFVLGACSCSVLIEICYVMGYVFCLLWIYVLKFVSLILESTIFFHCWFLLVIILWLVKVKVKLRKLWRNGDVRFWFQEKQMGFVFGVKRKRWCLFLVSTSSISF